MKNRPTVRPERRPLPRPLKPEELAGLHRVALEYRAALRAQSAGEGNGKDSVAAPVARVEPEGDGEAGRRARFAAGIARAEFGRFYWKEPATRRGKAAKPARNGKGG